MNTVNFSLKQQTYINLHFIVKTIESKNKGLIQK